MMAAGLKSKYFLTRAVISSSLIPFAVPEVSTMIDTGSATPMAYATWTWHWSARPAATIFFATYLAM